MFDPNDTEEDRAYFARIQKDEKRLADERKAQRKTTAGMAMRDAAHAKLAPLFDAAGLNLPEADANDWKSYTSSLKAHIEAEQAEIYRMEAELRLKKKAKDAAEMFYYSHHV